MEQLKKAGVDLSQPDTVLAIVKQLDDLVTRLERELGELGAGGSSSGCQTLGSRLQALRTS